MDNVVEISHSLNKILGRMETGRGLLGQLTSDTPDGKRLQVPWSAPRRACSGSPDKVENGEGPLPRLLNDRALADQLARSLDRFEGLLDQAQNGPGLLPALLNDPSSRDEFNDTLASLQQVAQDLKEFTGRSGDERRPAPPPGEGRGVRPRGHRAAPPVRANA